MLSHPIRYFCFLKKSSILKRGGKKLGTGVKKYLNVTKQSKKRIVDDVAVNVVFSPPVSNNPLHS